jgi:hypothetical protein
LPYVPKCGHVRAPKIKGKINEREINAVCRA